MLIYENEQLKLSEYRSLYDIIISKDNLLRKIKENVDFSFVNEMLKETYCEYYGRPAKEPEMMFKLLFLKTMYDLSDAQLIENANHNMAYKFFLNLDPEDKVADSSLLTKFRKTRIKNDDILDEMLSETVQQAISKGIIKSTAILVDATHTRSKSKQETPTQALRRISKELRKVIYKQDFSLSNEFPEKPTETATLEQEIEYSKELIAVIEKRLKDQTNAIIEKNLLKLKFLLEDDKIKEIQSAVDEDAKTGYKSETNSFFGYKNHIAMTEERIITAIEVTSGEAPDGKFLTGLIEKTQANGVEVKEVIADTAYSEKNNLDFMNSQGIKPITKLNPIISNAEKDRNDGFEYIKDANCLRCPAGELSIHTKVKKRNGKKSRNTTMQYSFDIEKCKKCPFKDGCCKPNAKSKTYNITILSDMYKTQQSFQETDYFKERAKKRYMIEAKNAELKQSHGLDRCKYTGLFNMRRQTFFTAFVANVKRIVKLVELKVA
jgi:IS5 family transposase